MRQASLLLFRLITFLFCYPTLLALFQETRHLLLCTTGDGDAAASRVLQHATELIQRIVQRDDVLRTTALHHNDIGGIHLRHLSVIVTDDTRNVGILKNDICSQLVKTCLTDKQLIVCEVVGLDDINLLLNLTGNLLNLVRVAPSGNRVLVDTLNALGRHVQTLDIHLATGKHCGNLVQDTRNVLRVNQQRI